MITYRHQSWEENEREHAEERRLTAELIASGKKTAWEVQQENSLFPMNAKVEIDWADLSERFEPRPPASFGPGIETRHPYRRQSRRHDALLARQKRGVAAAQPRNHHRRRDRHPLPKRTNFRCLRGVVWQATRQNFPKRENAVGFYPAGSDFAEDDFPFSIHRRTKSQDWRESH